MSIAEKLTAVAQNQQAIATQYFKTSFLGDGTKKASIPMPFLPDVVDITGVSAFVDTAVNNFYTMSFDRRAAGRYSGKYGYCSRQGGMGNGMVGISSVLGAISYENGVFTWHAPALPAVWSPYVRYTVVAVRYPEQTTRQMVEEEIALLPDAVPSGNSGTLTYTTSQINANFTSEQWASLIGTKPNWSFSLI